MRKLLLLWLLLPFTLYSQVSGVVVDAVTNEPIYNARVEVGEQKTKTDFDGAFQLDVDQFPCHVVFSAMEYTKDSLLLEGPITDLKFKMRSEIKQLSSVVVSANRRAQEIEDVPISMEILPAALISNKGFTSLEQVVDQAPGVFAMDGQVSIRGGGGYAYGAGSRVMVLLNDIPLLSPDAADAKWNSVPLENIDQVEIIKGASSVLYGSGALNGVISMRTKEPSLDGDLKVKVQSGVYDNPRRKSLKWWDRNPTFHMADVTYGKMHKQWGHTASLHGAKLEGFRGGEDELRGRLSGTVYFRPEKAERLKTGVSYNVQLEDVSSFIIWESDSLAYTPLGGADDPEASNSLFRQKSIRFNVDPYLKYFDQKGNRHEIKTRYYLVTTGNESNLTDAATAHLGYFDYQFARTTKGGHNLILGATSSSSFIVSRVFGDHNSINSALYGQYERNYDKVDITGGVRMEYFKQDDRLPDSRIEWNQGKSFIPFYPVFRGAIHYEPIKFTHLRASLGQGVRFPSVAERFAATSNGGVIVFPNPDLKPETGWAAEIGVKQVFKMGGWKGILDVAGFINRYSNMIEFMFGAYNPDSISLTTNPDDVGYIYNWLGFSAVNAEQAQITGLETSFNGQGKLGKLELNCLLGYTFMNPISLNTDPAYLETFSDSSNILKYRFNHLAKLDVEFGFMGFFLGVSSRYSSYMQNIDRLFEDGIFGEDVLSGLKEYRHRNQKGNLVFDLRLSKKFEELHQISFLVNNILNEEYSSRPGDIQPPRNFVLQLKYCL